MGLEQLGIEEKRMLLMCLFGLFFVSFMVIDLSLLNKQSGPMSTKGALKQSLLWVSISLLFSLVIFFFYNANEPLGHRHDNFFNYLAAYVTEYALSVDNIFVIIIILRYFKVDEKFYHKVLFWGILGALVFRGFFIFLGGMLIAEWEWILWIFGAFLLYTGAKMLFEGEDDKEVNPEDNFIYKFASRYLNFTTDTGNGDFFVRQGKLIYFTPIFLVLLLIESTDLIFAIDSIPTAFGITQDVVIVYTSNLFAVMGLRAMFFLLSSVLHKFYLLQKGLSFVLIFIGIKMLLEAVNHFSEYIPFINEDLHIPNFYSLAVVVLLLAGSIGLSIMFPKASDEIEEVQKQG